VSGSLDFVARDSLRVIKVERSAEVSDDFWRKVRSEWGQSGSNPKRSIDVPVEVFFSRLGWLAPACKAHGVGVEFDEATISLIRVKREDRSALGEILRGDGLPTLGVLGILEESRFSRDLTDFQKDNVAKLLHLKNGANFSVPGAGKTTVSLAVYEAEKIRGSVEKLLVVAPLSAFEAWKEETKICLSPSPQLDVFDGGSVSPATEILVVNYQKLSSNYSQIADWVAADATMVILDEAHRMKRGRDGEWGSACLNLAFLAARRGVLTGTPAPQAPTDLVALFDFLWPTLAPKILPMEAVVGQPDERQLSALTASITPLFVRTTKDQLNLPPIITRLIKVPLEGLQREIYSSLRRQFSSMIGSQRQRVLFSEWGGVLMYLLEAATNPGLLPAGSSTHDPMEFRHPPVSLPEAFELQQLIGDYGLYETPAKFIKLAEMVRALRDEGRKVLIWSNFVRNLETLNRMLAGYNPAVIHGGVPFTSHGNNLNLTRQSVIDRFRFDPDCHVLLANPAALGEGVSLHQVCHDAIYLDRTFNAGQYLQSVDRIHRLGLQGGQETRVSFLVTDETIDLTVASRVETKAVNMAKILDDRGLATFALPDEEEVGFPIDSDAGDLAALFAPVLNLFGGPDNSEQLSGSCARLAMAVSPSTPLKSLSRNFP
jgi:SNF2 family DNA or RNA helicase